MSNDVSTWTGKRGRSAFVVRWTTRSLREEASDYLKCAADAVMVLRTGWLSSSTTCVSGFDFAREALGVRPDVQSVAHEAVEDVLKRRGLSRTKVEAMHPRKAAMFVIEAAHDLEMTP